MSALLLAIALIGNPFPPLQLHSLDGKPLALPPPGQITVIDLFASWCGPCHASAPALERLRQRYAGRVTFVALAEDDDLPAIRRFVAETGLGASVAVDPTKSAYRLLGTRRLPTTYVVDRRGTIRRINHGTGPGFEARLAGWLDTLLENDE